VWFPLGYQAKDRKITVVADEAETVRHIFRRYLDLGSLNLLLADLRRTGVKTKLRPLSNGRTIGGIPFTRGSLASLLRNRFYISEVRYKSEVFPGEQQPSSIERCSRRFKLNSTSRGPITPRPGKNFSHC
jgi:site-specific DNA recombinase